MIKLSTKQTKRLVSIHGWSGVFLGLLLYVVLLTGTLAVFASDIGTWSAGGMKSHEPLRQPLDHTIRALAHEMPQEYLEEITVFYNSAGHIVVFFHTHAVNPEGTFDEKGVLTELHPESHRPIAQREGFGTELFGADPAGALDEFLVELHVNLHLPDPWGLYATGLLGFLMLVSAISGILIHRHLIADLFVAPRPWNRLLHARDRHNLAGTWTLPFAILLAFTGAFLSFALSLGFPLLSQIAFSGDQFAMMEALVGTGYEENAQPAELANLDLMLSLSAQHAGSPPESFVISNYGRADTQVIVFHPPKDGAMVGAQNTFDGISGSYLGLKPGIGTQPSLGNWVFELILPLHFGTFAGLLSQLVWFALGLAACYVTLSGQQLWLDRRLDDANWCVLRRLVQIVGYGLPLAILGSTYGFFLSLPAKQTLLWTPLGFCLLGLASIGLGVLIREKELASKAFHVAMTVLLVLLPMARIAAGGPNWIWALSSNNVSIVLFDTILILIGLCFFFTISRIKPFVLLEKQTLEPKAGHEQ
ncbi:MAG: PepSY-associated TM helix domain-containing protein [Pseudomonadota bacterium]